MATYSLSDIANLIEKDILPKTQEQLENETYLMSKLPKNKFGGFQNNDKYFTPRYGRNESIASLASTATTLPTAGKSKYSQGKIATAYTYGVLHLDDRVIESVKGEPGAIVNIVVEEIDRMRQDMGKDINRQLFGDGTGVLSLVSAASTQTTITVTSTQYIHEGQLLTINGDAVQVVNVTGDTTFTVTANVTVASNETAVKTAGVAEMTGLYMAVDNTSFTNTYENIDASTNYWWRSYVNNTATTYTTIADMETEMRTALTAVEKYGKCDIILTGYTLRNKYMQLSSANKRYVNTVELPGGFGHAPEFDGVPMVADIDCQYRGAEDVMYFLDTNAFSLEKLKDLSFRNRGSAGIFEPVTGTTYYEAVVLFYANLMCVNRRQSAKLDNKA